MHDFKFKKNELYCENVKVADVAKAVGTPFYLYSHNTLVDHLTKIQTRICQSQPHCLLCHEIQWQFGCAQNIGQLRGWF
jgi:diaminopimelate decarboxylase